MATTRTETRDIDLLIDTIYEVCRSRDYLLSTTSIPGITILDEEYVEHPDESVFSSMTAERILGGAASDSTKADADDSAGDAEGADAGAGSGSTAAGSGSTAAGSGSTAAGADEVQRDVVTQTTVVSPKNDQGFTITGKAALPLNMGEMTTEFLFEPSGGGSRVIGTATADAGKRFFGKRLENKVLSSFPATIDQAITRMYDVLALRDDADDVDDIDGVDDVDASR